MHFDQSWNAFHGSNRYLRQVSGVFLVLFRLIPFGLLLAKLDYQDLAEDVRCHILTAFTFWLFAIVNQRISRLHIRIQIADAILQWRRLIYQYYRCNLINAACFKDSIHWINAVALVQFPSLMASSSQDFNFHEL